MSTKDENAFVPHMRNALAAYIEQRHEPQAKIARELDVSKTTLSLFLSGTYTGNNQELAEKAEQLIKRAAARSRTAKFPDFCPNVGNTEEITEYAQLTHIQNVMTLIYGPAGCGKSTALQRYANNTNGVIYVEADVTTSSPRSVFRLILSAMGETPKGSGSDILHQIVELLTNTNRLIIIDEAQHMTAKSFDAVRAIYDKAHVGILFSGNPSVLKRMEGGRQQEELDQFSSRLTYKCRLNNSYTLADISSIYSGYGFSKEILKQLYQIARRRGGLRVMVSQCRTAQNMALATDEPFTVEHLDEAALRCNGGVEGVI